MGATTVLRFKKRHPGDKDAHILQAGEVEKDLGLDAITDAALEMTLIVNPSAGERGTHDAEGAAPQPS
ncbi:hypothetical protein KR054_001646 [Drosophila jambulina]|nr:hypothetical protein KR054_001646 [Drosophila jambulina]